jgi:hypothetical protein
MKKLISYQITWTQIVFFVIVTAAALSFFFDAFPVWIVGVLAAVHWAYFLWPRVGGTASIGVVTLFGLWLVLATELLVYPSSLPILQSFIVALVLISAIPLWGSERHRVAPALQGAWRRFLRNYLPALMGSATWAATLVVAQFLPGASRLAWVTAGDSANNILMARDILLDGGIRLGDGSNPVPLSSGLVALLVAPVSVGQDSVLARDLVGLASLWSLLIIGSCFLIGLLAKIILTRLALTGWSSGAVVAISSLIPITWFYSGYPLEYGFLNAELALLILFAGLIILFAGEQYPALTLSSLFIVATLLLAVWSPLVLIPSALGLVVFIRSRKELWKLRGLPLVGLVLSILQFLFFVFVATIPSLLTLGSALSAGGGAFVFPVQLLIVLALTAVLGALGASQTWKSLDFQGVLAVFVGGVVGLLILLFANRALPEVWTYYPLKFLWLACVLGLVFSTIYVFAIVVKYVKITWRVVVGGLAVLLAAVLILQWAPAQVPGYATQSPVARVLAGNFLGDADHVLNRILSYEETGKLNFLWKTGDPVEGAINFWILQDRANTLTPAGHEFRLYAYAIYDQDDVNSICTLAELNGGSLVVTTADSSVSSQLSAACPQLDITVSR